MALKKMPKKAFVTKISKKNLLSEITIMLLFRIIIQKLKGQSNENIVTLFDVVQS